MSYEFTGRNSPSQLASALQTYGNTGLEQNNPVSMPQNNQKTYTAYNGTVQPLRDLTDYQMQYFHAPEKGSDAYNSALPNYLRTIDQSEQSGQQQADYMNSLGSPLDNSADNVWGDSLAGMDTNADFNVYNPTQFSNAMQQQRQQSDFYDQNGGYLKQGGMGGNDLGNVDTGFEKGGMGGNFLGDVDFSKQSQPDKVNYDFAGRPTAPQAPAQPESFRNSVRTALSNPLVKDAAIIGSNLLMPGAGRMFGYNAAPTYSADPNTTFGQKAAHVADSFMRNLPIIGAPYAFATDAIRQHQANTDPWSSAGMQSNFNNWAKTVPYGNGMDMADPSYLQNQQLAKAMSDKGIGTTTPYAFTRGQ